MNSRIKDQMIVRIYRIVAFIIILISFVCVLLTGTSLILWARSARRADYLTITNTKWTEEPALVAIKVRQIEFQTTHGAVFGTIERLDLEYPQAIDPKDQWSFSTPPTHEVYPAGPLVRIESGDFSNLDYASTPEIGFHWHGCYFRDSSDALPRHEVSFEFAVPFWMLVSGSTLLSVPFILTVRKKAIRVRRRRSGLCSGCGYDLRSGPSRDSERLEVCPECGRRSK